MKFLATMLSLSVMMFCLSTLPSAADDKTSGKEVSTTQEKSPATASTKERQRVRSKKMTKKHLSGTK